MQDIQSLCIANIKKSVYDAALKFAQEISIQNDIAMDNISVEIPADDKNGNFACSFPLSAAKIFRRAPFEIAEKIVSYMNKDIQFIENIEIAKPGFINFFLKENYFSEVISKINTQKDEYGKTDYGKNKKVNLEFVSANPTGPMHMGNARGGALGDSLASIMQAAGYIVDREFYINDAGNQIDKFALSLEIRYLQHFEGEENHLLPEDSYHGEDIKLLAERYIEKYGDVLLNKDSEDRKKALVLFALPINIENIQKTMAKYRIDYDTWFHESDLYKSGEIEQTIELMKQKGLTYEKDGALWYKATEHGGEKDEVLVRANGTPTYFAGDIAYHRNKISKRKYDLCIDVWGADHHGHVSRLKNVLSALGIDSSKLEVVLMQLVRLVRDGEAVRMSKRTGKALTLSDLLEEIPIDASRFYFNMREANNSMDFDLDLAVKKTNDNPVYYCQYAYARICSIFRNTDLEPASKINFEKLNTTEEKRLIFTLSSFPKTIINATEKRDPSEITKYVLTVANEFHSYYSKAKIITQDKETTENRLALCKACAQTMKNALSLMKIDAPEKM
ncbi:MAG: arginine--tRNA ligase [Clostridia bacterium]|nr:arginine--tRNA ligase [Clostridia bacterium]